MKINEIITEDAHANCDWCKANVPVQYIHKVSTPKGEFGLCDDCYEQLDVSGMEYDDINEDVSAQELQQVEKFADALWGKVGIDVEFTRHFFDRINDPRNRKPISPAELIRLFKKQYQQYGKELKGQHNLEAVMNDLLTKINLPFVLKDVGNDEKQLIAKTIMRKKDFKTSNKVFTI